MRSGIWKIAFVLIVNMLLPRSALALLRVTGPEIIKTECEGEYRVKALREPPMPGGGGGAGGPYLPVKDVILTWKVIPDTCSICGSFTTAMPTVTNTSGYAFATYKAPDTVWVGEVKLQASGKCPPKSKGKDKKSREKIVTILGDPPQGFSSDPDPDFAGFDFQRYFLTGFTYLKMRNSMGPTDAALDETLKQLRTRASVRYDSGLSVCAEYDEPFNDPPPYHIRFAHRNSCMTDVDAFVKTIIHEGRHAECNLMFLNGEGDDDGDGDNDDDGDEIVDECDIAPNTPASTDPITGANSFDDAEFEASVYENLHFPSGCP